MVKATRLMGQITMPARWLQPSLVAHLEELGSAKKINITKENTTSRISPTAYRK